MPLPNDVSEMYPAEFLRRILAMLKFRCASRCRSKFEMTTRGDFIAIEFGMTRILGASQINARPANVTMHLTIDKGVFCAASLARNKDSIVSVLAIAPISEILLYLYHTIHRVQNRLSNRRKVYIHISRGMRKEMSLNESIRSP